MNLLNVTADTWISVGIVAGIFAGTAIIIGLLIFLVGKFFKVDVDENAELARRYGIMSIPQVMVFKNGEEAAKSVGYTSKSETAEFLGKNL